jgi:hypothetical protein
MAKLGALKVLYNYLIQAETQVGIQPNLYRSALQRHNADNSKQIFPEKELRGLSRNFLIFVSVSDIHIFPGSVCLFCCLKICELILGIFKSLTDT